MSCIEDIKKINPGLVKQDGSMKPFQEQLLEYKYGIYPKMVPLVVSLTSNILGIDKLSDLPIIINPSVIDKVEGKYSLEVDSIICLEEQLKSHVLAFESITARNSLVLILNQKDHEDNHVICALQKNVQSIHIEVNAIRSIYGKENVVRLVCNTYLKGKEFYPNKKTDDWIKSVGVQFPNEIINHLSLCFHDNKGRLESQGVEPEKSKKTKHI